MDITGLVIILVLILLSAFFSGSETALMSLTPAKVRNLCDQKVRFARFVKALKSDLNSLLITILFGNNLVNIGASVYSTYLFSKMFGSNALGLITGILTLVLLIFGEVVPKTLGARYHTQISLAVSPILYFLSKIFVPIIFVLSLIIKLVEWVLGAKTQFMDELVSEDELKAMISIGAEKGSIDEEESELIHNVLEFNDIFVEEVMTPRINIDALSSHSTVNDAVDFVLSHSHTRIPVYQKTIDNVIGIITVRDILEALQKKEGGKRLSEIELQDAVLVPETKKINDLFRELQNRRVHMAIVVDEYGGTSGLVTMEDLFEELVGEIDDEHDDGPSKIIKVGNSEWSTVGEVEVYDINEELGITLPVPEHKPLAYYILKSLNRFPRLGEKIEFKDFIFTVESMEGKKIQKISIDKKS